MLALPAGILGLFIWGRWHYDLVAFSSLLVAAVLGLVESLDAFQGFGHPAVITVAALLIVSRVLSGLAKILLLVRHLDGHGERRASVRIGTLDGISSILSAFINNVGALALFMPVALRSAHRAGHASGLVLMPLAFASILGGLVTLIGTPANIFVAGYRAETADQAVTMFESAPVSLPVAVAGVTFVSFFGWRLIPRARREAGPAPSVIEIDDDLTELRVPPGSSLIGRRPRQFRAVFESRSTQLLGLVHNGERIEFASCADGPGGPIS